MIPGCLYVCMYVSVCVCVQQLSNVREKRICIKIGERRRTVTGAPVQAGQLVAGQPRKTISLLRWRKDRSGELARKRGKNRQSERDKGEKGAGAGRRAGMRVPECVGERAFERVCVCACLSGN